ncbi:MAG: hypothetical protein QW745_09275 [Thermoplasmata archaeon]
MRKLESFCNSLSADVICYMKNVVPLKELPDYTRITMDTLYKNFEVEKIGYEPDEDRVYIQARYSNIITTVII